MKFCRADKRDLASTASDEEQTFVFKTFLEENPQAVFMNFDVTTTVCKRLKTCHYGEQTNL